MLRTAFLPDEKTIYDWIAAVHAQGIRRPGYPADRWAEEFCADRMRAFGLERVRLEPVELPYWEPRSTRLCVDAGAERFDVPCFALPFSLPTPGIRADLAAFEANTPDVVRGKASLYDVAPLRVPPDFTVQRRRFDPHQTQGAPEAARRAGFCYDPRNTMTGASQVLPFGPEIQQVMEPSITAGAVAFVGVLRGYPGGGCDYYVPYDGIARAIPGVWVAERDGDRLRTLLERSTVNVGLQVDAVRSTITSYNIVGELAGSDDECVIVGTHHDGPWSSAVEDGSGIALVLAQASYWSKVSVSERPHRLVFLINGGHMVGGAGVHAFIERHRGSLDRVVLEVHLEHAAREFIERDGILVPSGEPEPRWWFTSRIPSLEAAVWDAIESERLERSLLMTPDALAPIPTTDGGPFHAAGVPLVNFLTAPFYLFDRMDNMDKIEAPSLVPLSRAAIRIIESTGGISASAMRAALIEPSTEKRD